MPISGRAYFTENIHHLKLVGVKPHTFKSVYLRDGAVVLHKRADSTIWQVRFKLYDRRWHVMSTKQHDLEYAKQAACECMMRQDLENDMDLLQPAESSTP